ncbi:integral membrane protein, TerC family [Rubrobacter radiotolerans]|uniref:Integral membrane protein, TerC family n=1 Tax=Rubrobacter radiotolerans TaxID=42256 RepID=A0A023X095_RUBRA|nr:TerC family protein [Rubrobacter radiotolerans]AHY45440.1 integral membrane protein, TerC family [Rubrobacter radiotolerans]MDX5892851.1 TerC family protein [Rubrobacter radiotolerans]SMC02625.1 tellurite resistance protein TerC [Rubrobacter radiotolerans DSM 5868]
MSEFPLWAWVGFTAFIVLLLVLDLLILGRGSREITFRLATVLSLFWIGVATLFGLVVLFFAGPERGGEYFAGYIVEKSLSVDNVFVFALIFSYFAVPARYQYRVLLWGIIGALILRGVFILVGAGLLERYDWMVYVFGVFLIYTGIRMALHDNSEVDPGKNPVLRLVRRFVPMTSEFHKENFFVRHKGKLLATPLFAVIIVIGTTDVVFAVDSIPAIFAITTSAFIVWSANAFAVLGLRPLYFMLAGMMERFVYLSVGLSVILIFVGAKFIWGDLFGKVPIWVSLPFIATVVLVSILASLWKTRGQGTAS